MLSAADMGLVCAMGIGTVFVGLICIIVICSIMGAICKRLIKEAPAAPAPAKASAPVANKQEIIAACCAVIAEELGEDANNIRVKSFRKL